MTRRGIEKIRAVVMGDSEDIEERLDREITASKAAYKDPWQDAWTSPAANPFSSLLPVLS